MHHGIAEAPKHKHEEHTHTHTIVVVQQLRDVVAHGLGARIAFAW